MPTPPAIVSIQIGRVQEFPADDGNSSTLKPWRSAIVKQPVSGPVHVGVSHIDGDEQADLENHGGPDKAVLGYAASHYGDWSRDLPERVFTFGAFGENLTIAGIDEATCCIGDVFDIGDCRLQISQPRQPCWKLARRWRLPDLTMLVQQSGRIGWYFRVLTAGVIDAGMTLALVDRPFPDVTVASAHRIMCGQPRDLAADAALAECPALATAWRDLLRKRSRQAEPRS